MSKPLSNDDFFVSLSELFEQTRSKSHGSVFITQKRFTHEAPSSAFPVASDEVPFPDLAPRQPLSLIIHATNGKHKKEKKKLSTVVTADTLEGFFLRLAEVSKGGMSGLKKRDRSKYKKKKKKATKGAAAEEKK